MRQALTDPHPDEYEVLRLPVATVEAMFDEAFAVVDVTLPYAEAAELEAIAEAAEKWMGLHLAGRDEAATQAAGELRLLLDARRRRLASPDGATR